MNNLNTFYKTFSGTDAIAFIIFPETKPILLGSISTISHSVYREKKPVPLIGKINTGGYTRGMRSIAGTMVFTLINQHLVEDICEQVPYLEAHGKMKADELPFFDVMIICANEYGAASQMYIYGAEFYEDGQVISVQDLYIENTFSFVARDIDNFHRINVISQSGKIDNKYATETLIGYAFSKEEYNDLYENAVNGKNIKEASKIVDVQHSLKEKGYPIKITGVQNNETVEAIKDYQSKSGLTVTGEINDATYNSLINKNNTCKITNKNGTYVYDNNDKIIGIARSQEDYTYTDKGDNYLYIDFAGVKGKILKEDTNKAVKSKKVKYDDFSKAGIYEKNLVTFNPNEIGSKVTSNQDTEFKISALAYYNNGEVNNYQRYYTIKAGETKDLNLSYLSDSFVYNDVNKMPYMVEFIISDVEAKENKKWTVKLDTKGVSV